MVRLARGLGWRREADGGRRGRCGGGGGKGWPTDSGATDCEGKGAERGGEKYCMARGAVAGLSSWHARDRDRGGRVRRHRDGDRAEEGGLPRLRDPGQGW